jgi:poly(A) polymerase
MILPDARWRHRPGLQPLLEALEAAAGRTRFVGGCVRDTLLGLEVSDVDLATQFEPGEVIRRLEAARIKAVPTGLAHGTVTAVSAGHPVEVTTLRRDVSTDGRRATVAFTTDWKEDAARRDFTINALSADPATGKVHDYFGGLNDLAARTVRFIGEPLQRIAEDHLRILRFFRFHARFGEGAPDEASLAACAARANDMMALSRERIADELLKLLALPEPSATVGLMHDINMFGLIIPEIEGDGQKRLARLCERERAAGIAPDPLRRFAALLPQQPDVVEGIAQRLRLSKKAVKRVVAAVAADAPGQTPEQLAYWIGRDSAVDHVLLGPGDPNEARRLDQWARPTFPISGGDLIASGVEPGPLVARTLRSIEEKWVAEGFPDQARTREMLREAVAEL